MQKPKALAVFIALLVFSGLANAATIYGTVYDFGTLEAVQSAVVKISSVPEQRSLSLDGNYSFGVPAGKYKLTAYAYDDDRELLFHSEEISVIAEGAYEVDIILMPEDMLADDALIDLYQSEANDYADLPGLGKNQEFPYMIAAAIAAAAAIALAAGAAFYLSRKKQDKPMAKEYEDRIKKEALDELEKSGGRLEQKELREKLKYSETQISLVVTQLEKEGSIKKIKKGRANILVLLKK